MAKEILVTPEELRNRAKEIQNYKAQHVDVMNRMTNLIYSLSTVWRGDAQDAFVAKYMSMQNTYKNFENALEEFAELMNDTATDMENTDNNLSARINAI